MIGEYTTSDSIRNIANTNCFTLEANLAQIIPYTGLVPISTFAFVTIDYCLRGADRERERKRKRERKREKYNTQDLGSSLSYVS